MCVRAWVRRCVGQQRTIRYGRWLVAIAALLCVCGAVAEAAPQRIVSLKPNITEILFAIGAGDRVVGVTTWCNFPPAAARVAQVADYLAPNLEKVLAQQPDLVIGSKENSMRQPLQRLEHAGIRVVLLPFDTVTATLQSIRTIGALVGMDTATTALLTRMHQSLSTLSHALGLLPEPRVLLLVGHAPFVAAGPASFVGDLLDRTHAQNVVTTTAVAYPRLSVETILARNPQVIIDITTGDAAPVDWATHLPHVEAVRTHRLHTVSADLLRPGPRLAEGLRHLAGAVH